MLDSLPENIATYGASIDNVIRLIYYIVGAWFVVTEAVLIYFVLRYRKRAGQKASYQPGTTLAALAWILVPAALVLAFDLGIDFIQGPAWNEVKLTLPEHPNQKIRVIGRQFVWDFTHAGKDGELGTVDDIQTLNQLTVPVNSTVLFELGAADVIHSLWIPNLRLKQDAVPGRMIRGWFEATREGTYPIACAELCGSGHGIMKGELHVLSASDYTKWLDEMSPPTEIVGQQ